MWVLVLVYFVFAYPSPHTIEAGRYNSLEECDAAGHNAPILIKLSKDTAHLHGYICAKEDDSEQS